MSRREKSGNEMGMYEEFANKLNQQTEKEETAAKVATSTSQSLASSPANTTLQPQSSNSQNIFGGSRSTSPTRTRTSSILFPSDVTFKLRT